MQLLSILLMLVHTIFRWYSVIEVSSFFFLPFFLLNIKDQGCTDKPKTVCSVQLFCLLVYSFQRLFPADVHDGEASPITAVLM